MTKREGENFEHLRSVVHSTLLRSVWSCQCQMDKNTRTTSNERNFLYYKVHSQIDKFIDFNINIMSTFHKKPVNVSNLMEIVFVLVVKEFHPLPAERFSADRPYGYIGMNYYYKHTLLISEQTKAF